jgi:Tfp pilus assembly protein PilV
MVTIAIFAIGVLAVASMQIWSVRNTASGNTMTIAANLARAQMETLKNLPLTHSDLAIGIHLDPSDPKTWNPINPVDAEGKAGGIFTRTWAISSVTGLTLSRQIEVTVRWPDRGRIRDITLTSISRGNGT